MEILFYESFFLKRTCNCVTYLILVDCMKNRLVKQKNLDSIIRNWNEKHICTLHWWYLKKLEMGSSFPDVYLLKKKNNKKFRQCKCIKLLVYNFNSTHLKISSRSQAKENDEGFFWKKEQKYKNIKWARVLSSARTHEPRVPQAWPLTEARLDPLLPLDYRYYSVW